VAAAVAPIAATAAIEVGPLACRVVEDAVPELAKACKNPLMAAVLGTAICGNMSGAVKGSARTYARDRERVQEIRNSTSRIPRRIMEFNFVGVSGVVCRHRDVSIFNGNL